VKVSFKVAAMAQKTSFDGLPAFVAVAETLNLTAAARRLGVSPSAVSQAIRALEERLGTVLLQRSTRRVRLTDSGADYLARIAPALAQLDEAAQHIAGRRLHPSGPLRLAIQRAAFDRCVAPMLSDFCQSHPDIDVEVDVEGRMVDIVRHGFDAGIRYGDLVERDMVAVKVSAPSEAILVASPDYLARHGTPVAPADVLKGRAIMARRAHDSPVVTWDLLGPDGAIQLAPPRRMVVHDLVSEIELAVRGLGVACLPAASIERQLASGALCRILPDWAQPLEPLSLFFASHRQKSATLGAFIVWLQKSRTV
jgi:DNA-binding transcriptional LysR family regulator